VNTFADLFSNRIILTRQRDC